MSAPRHKRPTQNLQAFLIGTGTTEKTVSQLSIPIAFIMPFTDRLGLDVSTSYAQSRVSVHGIESSMIHGLTDTQIRVNDTLGDNRAVFTLGISAPTGTYRVPDTQQEAAGQRRCLDRRVGLVPHRRATHRRSGTLGKHVGPLSVNPSVTYAIGSVYPDPSGTSASIDVQGLRTTLLIRIH